MFKWLWIFFSSSSQIYAMEQSVLHSFGWRKAAGRKSYEVYMKKYCREHFRTYNPQTDFSEQDYQEWYKFWFSHKEGEDRNV